MKIKYLLFFALIGFISHSYAQIKVEGSVQDTEGEALPGVTVSLKKEGKLKGTTTDKDGDFTISLKKEGIYQLEFSYIGYESYQQTLEVSSDETYNLGSIQLKEKSYELQNVEIIGRVQQNYTSDYSFSATKTGIKNKELPQSLAPITKELIKDTQAFQVADAVKTVSGVSNSSFYNDFNIRGISQNESGQILNGMRTRQFFFLQPITSNIERIEVLKGPAAVTFSSVDPGGTINMVTKKPLTKDRKEISLSVGSFSTMRGTLDFTGPIDDDKKLLYRLNAAVQKAQSFRDLVRNNALLISPSISYIPNESTAINVEMIYSNNTGNLDRGQPIFGAEPGLTDLNSTPISLNLGATNDYFKSEQWIMTTSLSKKFSDKVSFNAAYMKQTWQEDLEEHRTENKFAVDSEGNPLDDLVAMRFVQRQQFWDVDNANAYIKVNLKTGGLDHKLLAGYDLHRWHRTNGGGQNAARGYLLKDGTAAINYDPARANDFETIEVNGVQMPKPNVSPFNLRNPENTIKYTNAYIVNSVYAIPANLSITDAIYIQEQLKFGKLTALLNARYEWFRDMTSYNLQDEKTFKNMAFIPRVGLSYAASDNINVYATYLEGYQPQSNTVDIMPNTEAFFWSPNSAAQFDPLISDLKEVGAKTNFFNNDLTMSMAIYEINQKNVLVPSVEDPDRFTQRGADRSRGVEWDMAGYILPNLRVNASYSYVRAQIMKSDKPELIGKRKENAPEHSAAFWGRYDFINNTSLKGLGIGFGGKYSGDKLPVNTRDFTIPAYTVFDAAIYYEPADSNLQLMVKLNNVFNKTYWLGAFNYTRLFPGAPRNALLTATYRF
ncbi:TonB-dependent receptor [Fulvivirga sediminis]|uniref:TonB-dependent receptor n=1 Tax=Fulvivirga sediminis TaxID=2803949 RepID=A0A937F9F9_9BACT|nr:TonB-dependent receptor [Fulvivirga sediminis]MBL3658761.1 TonB-dependent receptor [Fulvivirga sediminis]